MILSILLGIVGGLFLFEAVRRVKHGIVLANWYGVLGFYDLLWASNQMWHWAG